MMTYDDAKQLRNEALDHIRLAYEEREKILARYGQGVRPSHVSTDLAYVDMRVIHWTEQLGVAHEVMGLEQ